MQREAATLRDAGSGYAADMDLTPQVAWHIHRFSKAASGLFLWSHRKDAKLQ